MSKIGHFRVPPGLCIKMRLSAQPLIWKWISILMQIKLIFTKRLSTWPHFESESFRNSEMAYWKAVYHTVDTGWRWSECYVLKTNFVLTDRLYILQIKIKLKQVKELILIIRTVSWEFSTFAFPQTTIFESWGIIWLLPPIHCTN